MSHAITRPADAGRSAPSRANTVVAVLAFGGIVVSLMQTLVIPLVPELPKLLDASASDTAWAVTATLLAAAVATPVMGRLGDMYGKRKMLLVSLVLMVAGSVVCALSDSLVPMIVGRALQGLASGVIPLGISIMRDELPSERLGSATAMMSASLGIGGALGLPAAAVIADNFDWHILFWTSAALGAVAFAGVLTLVPESRVRTGGKFDLPGAVALSAALVALLLAISKGSTWGWTDGLTLGLLVGGVTVLLVWGWWELRAKQPLVDLRTTARPQVLLTNLASMAFGFSMFAMSLVLPQLLQLPEATGYGLGQTMLATGLVLAPQGLVMMITAPISAKISKNHGPKVTLMLGAAIVAVGYGLNMVLMSEIWHLVIVSCIIGAGVGFAYGAMPALIMGGVPASETAAANSLNTLMRSIGTSVSSAVAGVVLAQMTTTFGSTALPSENGFRVIMAIGAGAALVALLITSFIPRQRTAAAAATAPEAPAENAEAEAEAKVLTTVSAATAPVATTMADGGTNGPADDGIPVRGRVRGAESAPVPAAAVTLISVEGRQLGRSATQTDGSYAVHAPTPGPYVLIASADGYQPQAATIAVGEEPVAYDVLLSGTSGLVGVVRSADSGTPVSGAVVIVTDVRGDVLAGGRTDVLGEFTINDLVPGPVTLAVNSAKHRPLALPVEIGGAGNTRIEVELKPGASVRGTVRGAGLPLTDASVTLVDVAGNVIATTTTGMDGAYAFSDLDTGDYTVIATGYPPKATELTVSGGGVDDHDVELAHSGE